MKRLVLAAVALALTAPAGADTDYGQVPCSDIGAFAAAIVHNRNQGVSKAQELKNLRQILGSDDPTYPTFVGIINDLYSHDPGIRALSEDGARDAYTIDCEASRT